MMTPWVFTRGFLEREPKSEKPEARSRKPKASSFETGGNIPGMRKCALALLVLASACAPKIVPAPVVTVPKFPEFVQPPIPAAFANSPVAATFTRGWAFFQAGDLKTAEREFLIAVTAVPSFHPAETSLGYVELARRDAKAALPHFDRVLEREQADVPALLGRGQALLALNREADALGSFEAALSADPTLTDVRRRVEVLKFRSLEQRIARARDLVRQGRIDEAVQAYSSAIASSPDSPFLYREIAGVERQKGNLDAALADFRKALALDPTDARSLEQIGDILDSQDDLEGAEKAFADALALEPSPAVEKKLDAVRERIALSRLPAEYRAIDEEPQITRGDLAALIAIRLAPLLQTGRSREAVLITDARAHWAATWIIMVARAGIMDPFANHTFQPRSVVRRTDLAQAVARLLGRMGAQHAAQAKVWDAARLKFTDLSPGHLAYPAASMAVAAGVMKTESENSFQPARAVTGPEAIEAISRLEALAGLTPSARDLIRW
jgi:tetratricopeptide (TPR) repeat protein